MVLMDYYVHHAFYFTEVFDDLVFYLCVFCWHIIKYILIFLLKFDNFDGERIVYSFQGIIIECISNIVRGFNDEKIFFCFNFSFGCRILAFYNFTMQR